MRSETWSPGAASGHGYVLGALVLLVFTVTPVVLVSYECEFIYGSMLTPTLACGSQQAEQGTAPPLRTAGECAVLRVFRTS